MVYFTTHTKISQRAGEGVLKMVNLTNLKMYGIIQKCFKIIFTLKHLTNLTQSFNDFVNRGELFMERSFETQSQKGLGQEMNRVKSFMLDLKNFVKEVGLRSNHFSSFEFLYDDGDIYHNEATGIVFIDLMSGKRVQPKSPKEFYCCMYGLHEHCVSAIERNEEAFVQKCISQAQYNGWDNAETKIAIIDSLNRINKTSKQNKSNNKALNSNEEDEKE